MKTELEKLKKQMIQASLLVAQTFTQAAQLIGSPRQFHMARLSRSMRRPSESLRFGVASCLIMVGVYYFVVGAVTSVKSPTAFFVGGALFNLAHLAMMGAAYAIPAKLITPSARVGTLFECVFYASILLPVAAFLSQPVAHMQVSVLISEPFDFSMGYQPALTKQIFDSASARYANFLVTIAYVYLSFLVYVGFRVSGGISSVRAAVSAVCGFFVFLGYQVLIVLPLNQQFLRAIT